MTTEKDRQPPHRRTQLLALWTAAAGLATTALTADSLPVWLRSLAMLPALGLAASFAWRRGWGKAARGPVPSVMAKLERRAARKARGPRER